MAGFGDMSVSCPTFPNRAFLADRIAETMTSVKGIKSESIVILSLLEMSEADANTWNE